MSDFTVLTHVRLLVFFSPKELVLLLEAHHRCSIL